MRHVQASLGCVIGCLLWSNAAAAETIRVSPSDGFAPIEAAAPGDIVELEPGTYMFRLMLSQRGTAERPIIIRAADPSDPPIWDLSAMDAGDFPGSSTRGDRDRGCWQITGAFYRISSILIRGCHNGRNSAGVRAVASESLVLRDIEFRGNEVGLSGNGENTLVEFCRFVANGVRSSPPQHSTYIFGGSITMRHNFIHDSAGGQNLHIRAVSSVIEYNWIARASNYEIDMMTNQSGMTSQEMVFRGNVLLTHAMPENRGQVFVLLNDSGAEDLRMDLHVIGNTIIVQGDNSPVLVNVRNDTLTGATVELRNNVIIGVGSLLRTREGPEVMLMGSHNWLPTGTDVRGLTNSTFGEDPELVDAPAFDYRPAAGSALIGAAAPGFLLVREYASQETLPILFRERQTSLDIGAFEHDSDGPTFGAPDVFEPMPGLDGGGGTTDAGMGNDAGTDAGTDAGPTPDGAMSDGAMADGGADSVDSGCGCRVGASRRNAAFWPLLILLLAMRVRYSRR